MLDFGLYAFYVLLAVAVLAAIVFPIVNGIKSPKELKGSLIGLGVLLVIFGISYAISGSEVSSRQMSLGVDETEMKLIGAGIVMFYITLVLSIVGLIYSEISKAIK
jgi:hypothetical protein